jgi:hypothetical protein
MRTTGGLLTRALTYLITMVDLTNMSRHDPTVRRQHFNSAPCPWMLVVKGTLSTLEHPLGRFKEHAHHWGSFDPRANIYDQNGQFEQ